MKNKGITLIALVITIVVLIILASVAITLSLGDNGVFKKAAKAKQDTLVAQNEESVELAKTENKIDEVTGIREESQYFEADTDTQKIIALTNQKYKVGMRDLFNNNEYVNNIIQSQDALNYIMDNEATLNEAINSNYMMTALLIDSSKSASIIEKLEKKSNY